MRQKWASWAVLHNTREARPSLSSLLHGINHWLGESPLALSCVTLGEGNINKVKLLFTFFLYLFLDVLLYWHAWTSQMDSWTPRKLFLSVSYCSNRCFCECVYGGVRPELPLLLSCDVTLSFSVPFIFYWLLSIYLVMIYKIFLNCSVIPVLSELHFPVILFYFFLIFIGFRNIKQHSGQIFT